MVIRKAVKFERFNRYLKLKIIMDYNNYYTLSLLKNEMLTRMGKNKIEQFAERDTQEKYTILSMRESISH